MVCVHIEVSKLTKMAFYYYGFGKTIYQSFKYVFKVKINLEVYIIK